MKFIDARRTLPRNPSRSWSHRDVGEIAGGIIHHTAGGDDPESTARYHIKPNHVSPEGMPGIAYTFYLRQLGEIWWCNDLEDRTWSHGGKQAPDVDGDGDIDANDGLHTANGLFVGIVLGGSFESSYNHTGQEPTPQQILALFSLWAHLVGEHQQPGWPVELFGALSQCTMADLWGHADFGKPACPGRTLTDLLAAVRTHRSVGRTRRYTDGDWQLELKRRGYDIGRWGPNGDGVDGKWGADSKAALLKFQADKGLPVTGHRDERTADALFA